MISGSAPLHGPLPITYWFLNPASQLKCDLFLFIVSPQLIREHTCNGFHARSFHQSVIPWFSWSAQKSLLSLEGRTWYGCPKPALAASVVYFSIDPGHQHWRDIWTCWTHDSEYCCMSDVTEVSFKANPGYLQYWENLCCSTVCWR